MATLKDIVDEITIEATSIDSLFRNKERFMMFKYAKEGLKKLDLTFAQGIKAMNFVVPLSCKVYFPTDYQSFIRAYILGCDGKTIELTRNQNIPSGIFHYLIDCDGSVLQDELGSSLYDDCIQCQKSDVKDLDCSICCGNGHYIPSQLLNLYNDVQKYKNSWIKIHEAGGSIEFSSDLEDVAVVVEYMSNNYSDITECQINVPHDYEEALDYYIRFKLLEHGKDTKQDAMYYRTLYKNNRDLILAKANPLTVSALNSFYK